MDFLTKAENTAWVQERDIFLLPYEKPLLPNIGYLQFKLRHCVKYAVNSRINFLGMGLQNL